MTLRVFKRTVSAAAAAMCFVAAVPAVPLSASAESHKLISYDGYEYEYWSDSDDSTVTFDIDKKGGFDASWTSYGSSFVSKGLIDEQKPTSNNYKIDYDLSINFGPVQNATADNACTYVCAYGFLKQPAAEFFFTDYDSDITRYENSEYFTPLGSFDTDGKTYDLYSQKVNMHTIDSAVSYTRYLSIRRGGEMKDRYELGQSWGSETEYSDYSGEIDVGAHFDALEKLGEKIGDLDRLSLNVESYRSNGTLKLNSCNFTEYKSDNEGMQQMGKFEKNGGTYTYSSSCRPSKIDMKVNTDTNDKEFDYKWQGGSNLITKTFFSEPKKISADDVILFKEDYSFELKGNDSSDNSFSGILEMELSDSQKLCLVDSGTDFSQEKIAAMYAERGITAALSKQPLAKKITLYGAVSDAEKQEMTVYPFTYTLKDGDTEYTDYWVTNYPNDIYSYNESKREFCGNKILPDHSYRSYNIIRITDLLKDLSEYGLDANIINSASYTFSSENCSGSLSVNALKLDISHFNSGGYDFSPEYYGENDFTIVPNTNELFDFSWNNTKYGACTAMAEKHFDGSGLDLAKVKSIVADYSVTVDSVQVFGAKNDNTAVYLRGKLPVSDGVRSEFYIDLAYLGSNTSVKEYAEPIEYTSSVKESGRVYGFYYNPKDHPNGFNVSGFVSSADELVHQYWSLEQEPPVNGEEPASFSGSVDITEHLANYMKAPDSEKYDLLSDLAICADAFRSAGTVSVEKFDITVTYNDGTVVKYTPNGIAAPEKTHLKGDVNGDNVFSISDVVMLQQWLIGTRYIWVADLNAADLNSDGRIDIFDLCEMRKAVLQTLRSPVAVNITVRGGIAGVHKEWKVYEEDGKFILYFQGIRGSLDNEPFTAEITEEEYRRIMAQDYEMNVAPPLVMDGFYYNSVITYEDGTEKDSTADMIDVTWIMEDLLVKYKYGKNI